ncbi:hypothetical protein LUZ63_013784 [Rhynchospora breviuscula]|uniref:3'-5' exonuclease domain-containing protein n=1 Tax=Rhynchospora breviuscula TaxID=2022672 RepID=A0A9Q0C9M7_9POAL|nr:hypothetical protein LUZ63_013784 [Rhynchospora breviuscula]
MGFFYDPTDSTFIVTSRNKTIKTTVTSSGRVVSKWINDILHFRRPFNDVIDLVIGLHTTECCSDGLHGTSEENPLALLQLCVGHRCLIFQLNHCDSIPRELTELFLNKRVNFVGDRIYFAIRKLDKEYGLKMESYGGDLSDLTSRRVGRPGMTCLDKQEVLWEAMEIMRVEKPSSAICSDWGSPVLTPDQIEYAALDAFTSYELGQRLLEGDI